MFPSFDNIAQREQKRNELLDKVQLRVRQAAIKRAMYAEAIFAADESKIVKNDTMVGSQTPAYVRAPLDTKRMVDTGIQTDESMINQSSTSSETETETQTETETNAQTETPIFEGTTDSQSALENSTQTEQTQDEVETQTDPIDMEKEISEYEKQRAMKWLKELYEENPSLIKEKLPPKDAGDNDLPQLYIGELGRLYRHRTNNQSKASIDWVKTAESISMWWAMKEEEDRDNERETDTKKRRATTLESPNVKTSLVSVPLSSIGTDTTFDQIHSRVAIIRILNKYPGDQLESNGINLIPSFKNDVILPDDIKLPKDYLIKLNRNKSRLILISRTTNREVPLIKSKVDWNATLHSIIDEAKKSDLDLSEYGEKTLSAKEFIPNEDGLASSNPSKSSGPDKVDSVKTLSVSEATAKSFIIEFVKAQHDRSDLFPIMLSPVISTRNQLNLNQSIVFTWLNDELRFRVVGKTINGEDRLGPLRSGNAHTDLMRNTRWSYSLDVLIEVMEMLKTDLSKRRNLNKPQDIQIKKTLDLFNDIGYRHGIKSIKYRVNDSINNDLEADLKAFRRRYGDEGTTGAQLNPKRQLDEEEEKTQRSGVGLNKLALGVGNPYRLRLRGSLKGRGLRGAGKAGPGRPKGSLGRTNGQPVYANIKRTSKAYNLNDIQGTGLASAYIYKQIGSKFIRIPELNGGQLYLVQPSRNKVGPKIDISEELVAMIKDLIYEKNISQQAYDQLDIDDQKLFKEILNITHIQHAFRDELPDPLGNLRMEYDKLKGELMLGNDNPSIIKQLKTLCVDMYSNRLIGDSEFKEIITRLL